MLKYPVIGVLAEKMLMLIGVCISRKTSIGENVIFAPEEIAYINGFIEKDRLIEAAEAYGKSPYGEHLKAVAEGKVWY